MNQEKEGRILAERILPEVSRQTQVSCLMHTEAEAVRFLGVSTEAKTSCERLSGEVRLTGTVEFNVLYTDREGVLRRGSCAAELSDRLEIPLTGILGKIVCETSVTEADGNITADGIRLHAALQTCVVPIEEVSAATLREREGIAVRQQELPVTAHVATCRSVFELEESFENKGRAGVIYCKDTAVELSSVTAGADFISVEGAILLKLFYYDETKEAPALLSRSIPFHQEVEASGCSFTDRVYANVNVVRSNILATAEEGAEQSEFRCEFELAVTGGCVRERTESYAVDAFCPGCEYEIEQKELSCHVLEDVFRVTEKAESVFELPEGEREIYRVLLTTQPTLSVSSLSCGEDGWVVEGVLHSRVVYDDTSGERGSVATELPFAVKLPISEKDRRVAVRVCAVEFYARSRNGKEAELFATVAILGEVYRPLRLVTVSGITAGNPCEKSASLMVYFGQKGETLWDACKALGVTPSDLTGQNRELPEVFDEAERVVLYTGGQIG